MLVSPEGLWLLPARILYRLPLIRTRAVWLPGWGERWRPWLRITASAMRPVIQLPGSWLLATLVILLLLRGTPQARDSALSVRAAFWRRALRLLPVWVGSLVAYAGCIVANAPVEPRGLWWRLLGALMLAALAASALGPYAIVGLGLGVRRGFLAGVRLLWRSPAETAALVLVCGLAGSMADAVGMRNTFTLWMHAGTLPAAVVVWGTVADLALMALPALVTAWTMAAFLLFVMDHAEEAGARVEAQAADAPLAAKEPA